jgi:hypothetical protein
MIGSRLGPYAITAKLGEGGMGEDYRATGTRLDRQGAPRRARPLGVGDGKGARHAFMLLC